MNRKRYIAAAFIFLLSSCGTSQQTEDNSDAYTGPQVSADTRTQEEKERDMIQSCIKAYNEGNIEEIEEELNINLPPLPLEVTSLPEISSLSDLQEVKDDEINSNTVYVGKSAISDLYSVVYSIYAPTGYSFWSNGTITFEADPEHVTIDNPDYAEYKQVLDTLLPMQREILNLFYGIGIETSDDDSVKENYYRVISGASSIDQLKQDAQKCFTQEYLESTWYPSAFEGSTPIYIEIDGVLYAQKTDLSYQPSTTSYATDYIVAARDDGTDVKIDILSTIMGQIQPELSRLQIVSTADGYRLPSAY